MPTANVHFAVEVLCCFFPKMFPRKFIVFQIVVWLSWDKKNPLKWLKGQVALGFQNHITRSLEVWDFGMFFFWEISSSLESSICRPGLRQVLNPLGMSQLPILTLRKSNIAGKWTRIEDIFSILEEYGV